MEDYDGLVDRSEPSKNNQAADTLFRQRHDERRAEIERKEKQKEREGKIFFRSILIGFFLGGACATLILAI